MKKPDMQNIKQNKQDNAGEALKTIRVSVAEVEISKSGVKFVSKKTKDLPIPT
jgi:hypothetical protein